MRLRLGMPIMAKCKVGVLISGRGSNMAALIAAARAADYPAEIACVIANKADAGGLAVAAADHIPTHVVSHRDYNAREDFEIAIDAVLRQHDVDLVVLAGFMRVLTPTLINRWPDRMINIHPSLLPAFQGLHTHERAIDAGCKVAGCTVHIVRAELDNGPILAQATVPVLEDDTPDSLAARILVEEHRLLPMCVAALAQKKVRIAGMRTFFDPA